MTAGAKGTITQLNTTGSPLYSALNSFITSNDPNPSGKPKAYLNWILLDEQFNYVSSYPQSGAVPVGNYTAGTLGTPGQTGIPITKNGYLYIWVSNETQGWDVFFDNLSVRVRSGPILEENHYYPFGLTMAGISSKALKTNYVENKFRYDGGAELQNKEFSDGTGLEMYETGLRGYDQQIGRFHQIDPLADSYLSYSSYAYCINNPILGSDPSGANIRYDQPAPRGIGFSGGTGGGGSIDVGADNADQQLAAAEEQQSQWNNAQMLADGNGGDLDQLNQYVLRLGGIQTFSATPSPGESPGVDQSPAAAYVALEKALGITPSPNDPYLVQLIYEESWAGQASNISASMGADGVELSFTATSTGNSYSGFIPTTGIVQQFIDGLANNISANSGNGWKKASLLSETVDISFETTEQFITGAQYLANVGSKVPNTILRAGTWGKVAGTTLGAVAIGFTIADGVKNGWQNHHTVDIAITAGEVALGLFEATNPIGWGVALFMFVGNEVSEHYTNKSMSENLFDK